MALIMQGDKMEEVCSVIIPAYNCEKYLTETVRSVLRQTYEQFEIILVDDCSTDGTLAIAKELEGQDARIRVYRNPANAGVSKTRNFGVSKARGKWVAFLDSDDLWEPQKLEHHMKLAREHADCVLFYSSYSFMNDDGRRYDRVFSVPEEIDFKGLLKRNYIGNSTVMVRRDVIERIPMLGENLHEDYAAWLKILKEYGRAFGDTEPLVCYRIARNSRSSNKWKGIRKTYNVYRQIHLNILLRVYYVIFYIINGLRKYGGMKLK